MPTTADYLNDLVNQKNDLATALQDRGVEVEENETFSTLVPKAIDAIEAGGDGFYDAFWDGFQVEGNRTNYNSAFTSRDAYYWTNGGFNPKYDMKPSTAQDMFAIYTADKTKCLNGDLVELLEKAGVTLDFSEATTGYQCFSGSNFTRLGIIDFRKHTYSHTIFFSGCKYLEKIDMFYPPQVAVTGHNNDFHDCKALKHLTIGADIWRTINLKSSPLTLESAISVVTHLKDYSGTENEFTYTVTFSTTTWGYLDAEGETASPNGNSWREYINDKGWNAS